MNEWSLLDAIFIGLFIGATIIICALLYHEYNFIMSSLEQLTF